MLQPGSLLLIDLLSFVKTLFYPPHLIDRLKNLLTQSRSFP